ncbi:MAG: type II toxin-antitoxin system HicB family antitoxin [Spirochaetota bacterium]|nr:type II toxin-antitoxin system HicB family antitoxin [Spirochaetota bacterium]
MIKQYSVYFQKGLDGQIIGECPSFQACRTQGGTLEETEKNLKELIELCVEELKDSNTPLPEDIISQSLDIQ